MLQAGILLPPDIITSIVVISCIGFGFTLILDIIIIFIFVVVIILMVVIIIFVTAFLFFFKPQPNDADVVFHFRLLAWFLIGCGRRHFNDSKLAAPKKACFAYVQGFFLAQLVSKVHTPKRHSFTCQPT